MGTVIELLEGLHILTVLCSPPSQACRNAKKLQTAEEQVAKHNMQWQPTGEEKSEINAFPFL